MKIKRNAPCPCGSGKKYKKCCLNKDENKQLNLDVSFQKGVSSDYSHIESNAKNIYSIIKKYKLSDVIRAVFCLNLWRCNRSALAQGLSLNLALTHTNGFGKKTIQSYEDLKTFFNEVSDYVKITPSEDYTIDDFGEVFINHKGKTYPIITGTGHTQVYAAMRFMQSLASVCKRDEELIIFLEYIKSIIDFTKDTNLRNPDYIIKYELPSKEFWDSVNRLFDNVCFQQQIKAVSGIMGYQAPIESRHFVKNDSDFYPLFNSSLLIDYYKILLHNATEEEIDEHIAFTIHSLVENSYNFSPDTPNRVLINPVMIDKETNVNIIENGFFFICKTKENLLIAVNKDSFENDKQIDTLISTVNEYNRKGGLRLVERYYRKEIDGALGIDIESNQDIIFMLVDSFTDISSYNLGFGEYDDEFNCTSLDLIYMLGFSDSLDEVAEFIKYHKQEKAKIFSFGGKSNLFFTWKNSNNNIASGAIKYDFMSIDYNETEDYTYSYFRDILCDFPRNNQSLFCDPLNWKTEKADLGYNRFFHKGCYGFGGEVKNLTPDLTVFFAKNVEFFVKEDFSPDAHTALNIMDELNQRLFLRYKELISNIPIVKNKTLQLLYMPWNYAQKKHSNSFLCDSSRKLVFSDELVEKDFIVIRYACNPEILLNAIQNATNRETENVYLKELLSPLCKYASEEFKILEERLFDDAQLKKTVGVFHTEQEYYFSDMSLDTKISAISYTKARKEIAKVCFESGAEPGEYYGNDANSIIRNMQLSVVKVFEKYVSSFDKFDLHKRILNYYAVQQNGVILNFKRYLAFKDLDNDVQLDFEQKTRVIREEYRRNAETAKYFLETNLVIEHIENAQISSKEDFEFLLAFANWLVVLQDNADTCHYTDLDLYISVDSEYRVDTIFKEDAQEKHDSMLLRKYNTTDYHIKNNNDDADFFKKAMDEFNKDTNIDFQLLILLLDYMQLGLIQDGVATEIYQNVFSVDKSELIYAFNKNLAEDADIYKINDVINFITLNPSLLKTVNSKKHDILPIWEREKRDNRFDVKPIIVNDKKLIFSPVAVNYLITLWTNGITDWYLPYEIGLTKLKSVLKQWKKRYEDEMVQDVAKMFSDLNFDIVYTDFEFMRRFPKGDFPAELGDYDVIAISKEKQEIWIIESKVIQKVGSIYEDQMQQKSFFFQHKDDEKFQRRIDYILNNNSKVLDSFGIQNSEYKVIPYMVTNKLFLSRYKKVTFPIVAYDELKQILKQDIDE